jgi:hypothetical protein
MAAEQLLSSIKKPEVPLATLNKVAPVTKPSPTSVTGQPKTNANNSISGSIKPATQQIVGTAPVGSASPTQSSPGFKQGTNIAGTTVKLADGTDYTMQGASSGGVPTTPVNTAEHPIGALNTTKPTTGAKAAWGGTSTTPTTGLPSTGTNPPASTGAPIDEGAAALAAATAEQEQGLNAIKTDLEKNKQEDIDLINASYLKSQDELNRSLNVLQTLHEQNLNAIESSTAAAQVANENAVKKMEANTKLAQEQVDQKYLELKAAQSLENKRKEIRKETALGVLGGSFTTAGVADIEDTIIQGEQALNSLGLSNISQDKEFANQLNQFYDDYRQKNLEIQSTKTSMINQSYSNLMNSIAEIQASKEMSEQEKKNAILATGQNYNNQIANINGQIVQSKYELATNVVARADQLKKESAAMVKEQATVANQERDDARTALKDIIATYPAESFQQLTDLQKKQIQDLELKAGYPQGMVETGIESMKETLNDVKINQMNINTDQKQQLIELKKDTSLDVRSYNNGGKVTLVIYDKIKGTTTQIDQGQIGDPGSPYTFTASPDGLGMVRGNKVTGDMNTTDGNGGGEGVGGGATAQNIVAQALDYRNDGSWAEDFKNKVYEGGELGCAVVASGILTHAGVLDKKYASIATMMPALLDKGWVKVDSPQPGDVVVWGPTPSTAGHGHVGIVTGEDKAVNNSGKGGPVESQISGRTTTATKGYPLAGYYRASSEAANQEPAPTNVKTSISNWLGITKPIANMTRQEKINAIVTAQSTAAGRVTGLDKTSNASISKYSDKELSDLMNQLQSVSQTDVAKEDAALKKAQGTTAGSRSMSSVTF